MQLQQPVPVQVQASKGYQNESQTDWDIGNVTFSAFDLQAAMVFSEVAKQSGVSISIPEITLGKLISVDYSDVDGQSVFKDLASRYELVPVYDGQLVSFVKAEDAPIDIAVLRAGYQNAADVERTMLDLLGDGVRVKVIDDRLVITGTPEQIELARKYERYTQSGPDAWQLEVRIVNITKGFIRQLGLDWGVSGGFTLSTLSTAAGVDPHLVVQMIIDATETGRDATLIDSSTMYMIEATEVTLRRGQTIPVPRFTTSPAGTVSISGFDYVEAGFEMRAIAHRVPSGIRLRLEPTLSSVVGFVREAPVIQESTISTDAIVADGDWLLITGLESYSNTTDTKTLPGLPAPIFGTRSKDTSESRMIVMIKAVRVYSSE